MLPKEALLYIRAGHGTATLIGKEKRYTYKFRKVSVPRTEEMAKRIFVKLLTGPNNETDYVEIGYIYDEGEFGMTLQPGWRNAPAFKALDWYLKAAQHNPEKAAQAEFIHEGVCGRCGRRLTVPESIEAGIGPECATKL